MKRGMVWSRTAAAGGILLALMCAACRPGGNAGRVPAEPVVGPVAAGGSTTSDRALPRRADQTQPDDLIGTVIPDFAFTSIDGTARTLRGVLNAPGGRRGVVIAMASAECPMTRMYAPRLVALERAFRDRLTFIYINAVDGESDEAVRASIREYGLGGIYARDTTGSVRRALGPRTTTEVFVLDSELTLRYRGAVDDQYRFGGAASSITHHYLRDALRAVIDNRTVEICSTAAPGCLIDEPPESRDLASPSPPPSAEVPTFYPVIADILARNCLECHAPGGAASMPLHSPSAVEGRASMIAAVVREGVMPPTHRRGAQGVPVRDRTMPLEDRERLLAWLESSRPIGVPPAAAPDRLQRTEGTWSIGAPDLLLMTPGPQVNPDDAPTFGRYLVPVNIEEDRWIRAVECRSVMPDAVETAHFWLIEPGQALPQMNEIPTHARLLTAFSRADRVNRFEEGVVRLRRGSVIVADILARPMARPAQGQMRIAFQFDRSPAAPAAPGPEIQSVIVAPQRFSIAPGDARAPVSASFTTPRPMRLVAVRPLTGPRGHDLTVDVRPRGRSRTVLLELERLAWRWQIRYPLREPMVLPAGSVVTVTAHIDHSAANPSNPDARPRLSLGVGPDHELLAVQLDFVKPD